MATYAIGDVHGCYEPLRRLLARIRFTPGKDRLWFTGDLVNRGPSSLGVLRLLRDLEEHITVVLGNHDLMLLSVANGFAALRQKNTFIDVLGAGDGRELIAWLARRPFVHREKGPGGTDFLLVHSGLLPVWSTAQAEELGHEAEEALRHRRGRPILENLSTDPTEPWSDSLTGERRLAFIVAALTRLRVCSRHDPTRMLLAHKGRPDTAPNAADIIPWFDLPRPRRPETILFGHWSALGLLRRPGLIGLDTGCAGGGTLTACRLDDGTIIQVPGRLDPRSTAPHGPLPSLP